MKYKLATCFCVCDLLASGQQLLNFENGSKRDKGVKRRKIEKERFPHKHYYKFQPDLLDFVTKNYDLIFLNYH